MIAANSVVYYTNDHKRRMSRVGCSAEHLSMFGRVHCYVQCTNQFVVRWSNGRETAENGRNLRVNDVRPALLTV